MTDWRDALRVQTDQAADRALVEQDGNPYAPTAGCFDRRYWAWKLVDCPEATFQRLVLPLAQLYHDPRSRCHAQPEVLSAVRAGLRYAATIQHANGSFDQAFPFEQSYGATAFLLYPLLEAARLVDGHLDAEERTRVERMARMAAAFLCDHGERHGVIANHLAGAALSLAAAADRFGDQRFDTAAALLVDFVVAKQSPEGWFPEYDGADPGYQTLCVDYLSAYAERRPSDQLSESLARAVEFLQWFVHPDGTFGGIYGSRRTSVVYLAGLARLSSRLPMAGAMVETLASAMAKVDSVTASIVDVGNLAPLLSSTTAALGLLLGESGHGVTLPCERAGGVDFPGAGLHVRSTARHYAIVGASNGGTVTVFSRETRRLLLDDGGYVGQMADGTHITSQVTRTDRRAVVDDDAIVVETTFARMSSPAPTPANFIVLRLLNLTVMRSIAVGNWVKQRLVAMLIRGGDDAPFVLERRVTASDAGVTIHDRIETAAGSPLRWLRGGVPFSSIHMASAGYPQGARIGTERPGVAVDVARLARERSLDLTITL